MDKAEQETLQECKAHIQSLLSSRDHAGLRQPSYPSTCLNFLLPPKPNRKLFAKTPPAARAHPPHNLAPSPNAPTLNILISGAGLAGLATAIALRRHGHTITVLEKAPQLSEVGAGIQVPPNSSRLLLKWGLEPYLEGKAVEPLAVLMRRWEDGSVIGKTEFAGEFRARFGAPYYVVHRATLQLAMYSLALDLGVTVRTGCGVAEYDGEGGVVLESGEELRADLVVAADGLRSQARKVVLGGRDQGPQAPGYAVYRAMVETEKMKDDPDISWLLENPCQNLWMGDQRHVITYSIAGGRYFNMVLSHPEDSDPRTWSQDTAIDDMKKQFHGWDPRLHKVMNLIEKTLKWPLMNGTPLEKWIAASSKLLIVGDAAHTMVPYMSQGAATAVEDAAALAEVLSRICSPTEIPHALSVFERTRILRTGQMQEASLVNGKLWHFADGPEQRARDEASKPEVQGRLFMESPSQWSDPETQSWAYGYDAEKEMTAAWERSSQDVARL